VDVLERRLIARALARADGSRAGAARLLGVSRNGLALKMERLGLGD
jgi:transcriptional regulator with GAF, ATPase, and Fis domain